MFRPNPTQHVKPLCVPNFSHVTGHTARKFTRSQSLLGASLHPLASALSTPRLRAPKNGLTEKPDSASSVSSISRRRGSAMRWPAPVCKAEMARLISLHRFLGEHAASAHGHHVVRDRYAFPALSANTRLARQQAEYIRKQGRAIKGGHTADVKRRRNLNQVGTHELQAMQTAHQTDGLAHCKSSRLGRASAWREDGVERIDVEG